MSQRLPDDSYIITVEALVHYGYDVAVHHEVFRGERTGWVQVTAFGATHAGWCEALRLYTQATVAA